MERISQIDREIKDISFKTTLIFWKLYDSYLVYTSDEVKKIFQQDSEYSKKLIDGYYFENLEGQQIPLKWIATTGHLFCPTCLNISEEDFKCKDNPEINGKIRIEAHLFPEGVFAMQARLDFNDYMKIEQLIIASNPSVVILSDNMSMKDKLDHLEGEVINFLKTKNLSQKKSFGEKASPWHHNWIWWESNPEIPIEEFDIGGKYFKYALGMCTRSDKWRHINPENYQKIEKVVNLSPYYSNCVYITHPGNCIIPSKEFLDPNAVKNTIIDVLFATELGNVQRFLILDHLQSFNFKRLEMEKTINTIDKEEEKLDLDELIKKFEIIEDDVNAIVLDIYKDLQVVRTPRLIFTSVYKTKILKRMIEALHGFDFYDNLMSLIQEIRDSLTRARDGIRIKADEKETKLMNSLNILFVIGLAAQMVTMFYDVEWGDPGMGLIQVVISVFISIILLLILRKLK
jgi:hypothetical protein